MSRKVIRVGRGLLNMQSAMFTRNSERKLAFNAHAMICTARSSLFPRSLRAVMILYRSHPKRRSPGRPV